ncbi:uncharacterized protein BYT42DRAFT_574565 [Radiomyces spectabilis]|uniref:uncharacterized protein n=1 Tax=Radiomyces spectabilis TaxID=64574 RepID=UPI002220B9FB|nr:uncharacterized protein BYT42DRAFT_574565 [Radiomyces spectabilis]KAI8376431.1 hypothetical protein BYT42DRAFT_574565 [Radiomyces spectabilis]
MYAYALENLVPQGSTFTALIYWGSILGNVATLVWTPLKPKNNTYPCPETAIVYIWAFCN